MAVASILVFISHSSADTDLARLLIQLIHTALNIPSQNIRCTSVDGYRLPVGANTDEQLRLEVHDAKAFIGIVSAASSRSAYVLFELGARWGAGRQLSPVLAPGVDASLLRGPLSGINALRADSVAQLMQLVENIANQLDVPIGSAASYHSLATQIASLPPETDEVGPQRAAGITGHLARPMNLEERDAVSSLSAEARELLVEAAAHEQGAVFVVESFDGLSVTVGEREFVKPKGEARAQARAKRALEELLSSRLLENQGGDGSLSAVTDEGFRVADLLRL